VKFLLDHDVPDDLSYLLVELNHEVTLLREALPGSSSDEAVLQFALERSCVLTCNRNDSISHRRGHIMESTLSSGGEPGQTNGLRYFGCWNVLAKPVF
jgi:hypothetical protein